MISILQMDKQAPGGEVSHSRSYSHCIYRGPALEIILLLCQNDFNLYPLLLLPSDLLCNSEPRGNHKIGIISLPCFSKSHTSFRWHWEQISKFQVNHRSAWTQSSHCGYSGPLRPPSYAVSSLCTELVNALSSEGCPWAPQLGQPCHSQYRQNV